MISDSAAECFWVATGTAERRDPAAPPPSLERIRAEPRFAAFLELMPLGNRAEDFGVALRILDERVPVGDQSAYDAFKAGCDPAWQRQFHADFYAWRRGLARAHPSAWLAMSRPYPGIGEALGRLADRCTLAIATSKDRASVRALLGAYGLSELFPEERVLDKEAGPSKAIHVDRLCALTGADPRAALFVDDKVNHLDRVAALGARCALAAWGYNGARERELARSRGYPILGRENLESELAALGVGGPGP